MLDQLADAAPAAKPGLPAHSSDLEESIRHLTREDLAAYASGQLTPARLSYCQAHLDSCEECREELEDLRTFKNDLSAFPPPVPNRGVLRRSRRGLTLPQAATVAIIVVVAVSTALWFRHGSPRADKTPVSAATVAPSPAPPPPVAGVQARDTRVADKAAAGDARPAVPAATQQGKLQLAPSRPQERAPTSPGTPQSNPGFALLAPVGQVISDTRPEFSWQPLAGAVHYSVAIVDTRLHPVEHSHALHTTVWRPKRPLHRGRTYFWQVTATVRGGHKVVASAPGVLTESADARNSQ
jgi:Putative zinc-finger